MSSPAERLFENALCFRSYGVPVLFESNSRVILAEAVDVARKALLGTPVPCALDEGTHIFRLEQHEDGECSVFQDGELVTRGTPDWKFFRFFDSLVRILVAEFCSSYVFIHAGVVAWNGKSILIPANSFSGKTSLVAELVRAGAEYYSDEYALLDSNGRVHPFSRKLSMRTDKGTITETDIDPADLGGLVGTKPLPVGVVLFTKYTPGVTEFSMERLSPGHAVIEMINYTISIRRNPSLAMDVLRKSLERCVAVQCRRGEASTFVPFFLDFVDNTAI